MSEQRVTISVVVCTRDRPDDLVRCLQSIQSQSIHPNSVVIVLGSKESCPHDLAEQFNDMPIQIIDCFEHNISASRNAGVSCTQDDLIVFIDDDAIAHDGWIEAYRTVFEAHPDIWIAGGSVFDSRTNPQVHEFHQGMLSSFGLQSEVNQDIEPLIKKGYKRTVKGCNFAIRRDKVLAVGAFDPFFRFAYDEADLVFSVYKAQGRVVHCDHAIVDHAHTPGHYRQSGRMDHDWHVEYASHTMFMLKHSPPSARYSGEWFIVRRYLKLVLTAILCVFKGETTTKKACQSLAAAVEGIRDAHKEFHKRNTAESDFTKS